MSTVEEIEKAVTGLRPSEYEKFREWLTKYDNQKWDRKLDADSESGRLDKLAEEALQDLKHGRTRDL